MKRITEALFSSFQFNICFCYDIPVSGSTVLISEPIKFCILLYLPSHWTLSDISCIKYFVSFKYFPFCAMTEYDQQFPALVVGINNAALLLKLNVLDYS